MEAGKIALGVTANLLTGDGSDRQPPYLRQEKYHEEGQQPS